MTGRPDGLRLMEHSMAKHSRSVPVLAGPAAAIETWQRNPDTLQSTPSRPADFWMPLRGNKATYTLCCRNCLLKPGESSWCIIRHNVNDTLAIPEHGPISNAQPHLKSPRATGHPATDLLDSSPRCWMGQVNA